VHGQRGAESVCREVKDGLGVVRPVGRAVGVTLRRLPFCGSLICQATSPVNELRWRGLQQHFWTSLKVAASALSIPGVRRLELAENGHVPSCRQFAACSNLVRRPGESQVCTRAHKTSRSLPTTTSRKAPFGGAWHPSSPVRRCTRARLRFSAYTQRVLRARVAGPHARCASSLSMIRGAILAYSSSCARGCAAREQKGTS